MRAEQYNNKEGNPCVPTVLVIQARRNPERIAGEQENLQELANPFGVRLVFVNPLMHDDVKWENPKEILRGTDGVFLTGSADIDLAIRTGDRDVYIARATALVREAGKRGRKLRNPLPVFGDCLGHQMIHQSLGGIVARTEDGKETGTVTVALKRKALRHPYFTDVPLHRDAKGRFRFAQVFGHKDTVVKPAPGFRVYGTTPGNPYSLTVSRGIFSTQGHPEITEVSGLQKALEQGHGHDPRMGDYELNHEFVDTPGANKVISNYFQHVAARATKLHK